MDLPENNQSKVPTPPDPRLFADRFELQEILGRGRSGTVYRALDRRGLGTEVALKVFSPAQPGVHTDLSRFTTEVSILHDLSHPFIVRIFGHGVANGVPFISMELIEGAPLDTWVLDESPSPERKVRVLTQLTEALAAVHRVGLVHRDLKPSNIMVRNDDSVKVVDFGVATSDELRYGQTVTGEVVGTPAYMAPEQWSGGTATPCSDIYSFGLIAAVTFGVQLPPPAISGEQRERERNSILQQVERAKIGLPFRDIIQSCLEPNPNDRIKSGIVLFDLIRNPGAPWRRIVLRIARRMTKTGALLLILMSVAAALVAFDWRAKTAAAGVMLHVVSAIGISPLIVPNVLLTDKEDIARELTILRYKSALKILMDSAPDFQFTEEVTPLNFAVTLGDAELIHLLAPHSIRQIKDPECMLIGLAIGAEQLSAVDSLLDEGMNTSELPLGVLLILARRPDAADLVMRIIDAGFNPMRSDSMEEWHALPSVSLGQQSSLPLLERLIQKYPAELWPFNNHKLSGLAVAVAARTDEVVPLFYEQGVDLVGQIGGGDPLLYQLLARADGDERFVRAVNLLTAADKARLLAFEQYYPLSFAFEHVKSARLLSELRATSDVGYLNLLRYSSAVERRRASLQGNISTHRWGISRQTRNSVEGAMPASGELLAILLNREEAQYLSRDDFAVSFRIALANSCGPCLQAYLGCNRLAGLGGTIESFLLLLQASMEVGAVPEEIKAAQQFITSNSGGEATPLWEE